MGAGTHAPSRPTPPRVWVGRRLGRVFRRVPPRHALTPTCSMGRVGVGGCGKGISWLPPRVFPVHTYLAPKVSRGCAAGRRASGGLDIKSYNILCNIKRNFYLLLSLLVFKLYYILLSKKRLQCFLYLSGFVTCFKKKKSWKET